MIINCIIDYHCMYGCEYIFSHHKYPYSLLDYNLKLTLFILKWNNI